MRDNDLGLLCLTRTCEKSTAVLSLCHVLSNVSIIGGSGGIPQLSSSTSSALETRLFCTMYRATFT